VRVYDLHTVTPFSKFAHDEDGPRGQEAGPVTVLAIYQWSKTQRLANQ
jgi:hypothetical protein